MTSGGDCYLQATGESSTGRPAHTCAVCGHRHADNRRTQAVFTRTACGHTAHAVRVNTAVSILRAGLARQTAQAV